MVDRHDPSAAPQRSFWLDELCVARFYEIAGLLGDVSKLEAEFEKHWSQRASRAVAEKLFERFGDSPEVRCNLLLLDAFLEKKNGDAIRDAARTLLGDKVIATHPAFRGRGHRLAAAGLVYLTEPAGLLDLDLWHQWHPRRRCAMKLVGHRRKPSFDLCSMGWEDVARRALDDLGRGVGTLEYRRAVARPWRADVLVAFRDRGALGTVRRTDGRVEAGARDDWTFLRFHDEGYRLDVTSTRLERAHQLANNVASVLWGDSRRFTHARDPLSRARLDAFLERLTSPADQVFKLLEIIAEVPGRWREPVIRVGNTGSERVEQVVQDLRQMFAFARCSTHVHRVKLGFENEGKSYRIELHFPPHDAPDDNLVLSYGDRGWNKDVAGRFEALLLEEIGVEVHPKDPGPARKRRPRQPARPKKIDAAVWRTLLAPHVDDPADWQLDLLRGAGDEGLLRLTENAVFRCGDPRIPLWARPDATFDCEGLVVMPFGAVSDADPFAQEPGTEYPCSSCGNRWSVDSFRYPVFHRVTVEVVLEAAWATATKLLTKRMGFDVETAGVLTRVRNGLRQYVVDVGTADRGWLDPNRAAYHPICWFGTSPEAVSPFRERGVHLAELLGEREKGVRRVLSLGLARVPIPSPSLAAEGPAFAPVPPVAPTEPPDLAVRLIQPGDDGIYLQDTRIIEDGKARLHLLFALLQAAAEADPAATARRRTFRTAASLTELDESGEVEVKDIHQWVHRARKEIENVRPGLGHEIIESAGKRGYRLGPGFECSGFDLQAELGLYKPRRRVR